MSNLAQNFELRTYTFLDQLQPQLAQFVAKDNRVYDPAEYDAALFIEIAPAMEIHTMVDRALKATRARLGSVVTERVFGMMQVQHHDQGEVIEAGENILRFTGLTIGDRAEVKVLATKVIRSIEQDHAIYFTGTSRGNMVVAGESVFILEASPAAYLAIACNEALKAADIKLVTIRPFGATGRLVMSGPEAEIDAGAAAAHRILEQLNDERARAGSTAEHGD